MVASLAGVCYDCNQCLKAATAIETLMAERDAAVAELDRIAKGEKKHETD